MQNSLARLHFLLQFLLQFPGVPPLHFLGLHHCYQPFCTFTYQPSCPFVCPFVIFPSSIRPSVLSYIRPSVLSSVLLPSRPPVRSSAASTRIAIYISSHCLITSIVALSSVLIQLLLLYTIPRHLATSAPRDLII